jgi:hypothetical protein
LLAACDRANQVLYRNPTRSTKRTDFWLGFSGAYVVNIVVLLVISGQSADWQTFLLQLLVLVNFGGVIVVAFLRNFAALGMVTAYAVAFAAAVLGGVFFTAGDFVAAGGSGITGAIVTWVIGAVVIVVGAIFALVAIHRGIK